MLDELFQVAFNVSNHEFDKRVSNRQNKSSKIYWTDQSSLMSLQFDLDFDELH